MLEIGKKIKEIRENKNISQEELAKKLGVSEATIANYEAERRTLTVEKLQNILFCLETNLADFLNEGSFSKTNSRNIKKIPIISRVNAGLKVFENDDILDYLEISLSLCNEVNYATFVKGDSMEPKILDNDLILVHQTSTLNNGNIGLFKIGEEILCRKFFSNPITKEIVLKSLNKKYDPIYIEKNNKNNFSILGKVICKIDYNF